MSSVYPPFGETRFQRCLRCGTPLPANGVTCVNCGTYNPVAQPAAFTDQRQAQWGSVQSQASMNGGQFSSPQMGQSFNSPPQYPQWSQPSVPSQQNVYSSPNISQSSPSSNYTYPMPGQIAERNFNGFYVTPQQNANYFYPSTSYGRYAQPSPQKKRKSRAGFIVGIGLFFVLLIGGGLAGYYYFKHHVQNNTSTSTSSALLTPTAIPLFSDAFTSNNMGWDLTSNQGKFSVKVGGGSLVLEDDQNKLLWEIVPNQNFSNFRLDVNATLTRGDVSNGYGVFIRASNQDGDLATYYRFELYGDGTYAIFKGSLDTSGTERSDLVQGYVANSAIAKVGQVNHITIVANGSVMTLIVNGQTVYTYTDDNYKGGSIALFVSNLPKLTPGAQATFKNLAIYPISK